MFVLSVLLCMSTYQGCLYCKFYCVCRHTKDIVIVSITVYVDLPRCLHCKYYCVYKLTKGVCMVNITVYVDLRTVFVL